MKQRSSFNADLLDSLRVFLFLGGGGICLSSLVWMSWSPSSLAGPVMFYAVGWVLMLLSLFHRKEGYRG